MNEYRTSDLALCAYLHLEGYGHSRIDVAEPQIWNDSEQRWVKGRAEMVFSDGDGLRDAVMEYQTGNALIEPREFMRRVGWTRGLLLDAVREGRGR